MEKPKQNLPYEENDKSFGQWFREAAKEKWQKYLNGDEKDIPRDEIDAMRKFLIEQGTRKEIQIKLDSFGLRMLPYEALLEEVKGKRPDLKFEEDEIT